MRDKFAFHPAITAVPKTAQSANSKTAVQFLKFILLFELRWK